MEAFCSLFKLPVDYDKSFAWASAPGDRKALELLPCRAVRAARDLGGTLSFSGTLRNSSLVERCRGLAGRWNALKRAPGSLDNKARTLWTCFWPRALHGIVTCRLGDQRIKQLRSAAVAALQLKCAGGNPILRLTLEFQCIADPGYYQIATTLRDSRRLCHKQPAHVNEWAHFMRQYDGRLLPGPFSKLIEVCNSLGWTIINVPIIQDHDGDNFNLLTCATNELDIRLSDAWAQHIAGQVQHRKSMNGLRGLDLACTTRRRSKYNSLQARLVAAIWDGSFRAVCYHAKYDLTKDAQCPRCHVTDDYRHQVAVCPRFHSCRGEDQWAADIWDTLPECISQRLLIPRNPMLADIKKALGDLPDRSTEFHLLPNDQDVQHVFTDGSCFGHADPHLSLAAWGAILPDRGCLAAGHLSRGIVQSVNRAELTAVIATLRWSNLYRCNICIWTDSQYVSDGANALLQDPATTTPTENADLWTCVANLIQIAVPGSILVRWIPSHLNEAACESPFEEWAARGNNQADGAAVAANKNRPVSFAELHGRAVQYYNRWAETCTALSEYIFVLPTSLVRMLMNLLKKLRTPRRPPWTHPPCGPTDFLPEDWDTFGASKLPELPLGFVKQFLTWILKLDEQSADSTDVSYLELVLHYQQGNGQAFPIATPDGGFQVAHATTFARPTVASQLRIAARVIQTFGRHFALVGFLTSGIDSLVGFGVHPPQRGVRIGCGNDTLRAMRSCVASFSAARPIRVAADLARPA